MPRPAVPLFPRIDQSLTSTNPDEHWFWKGKFTSASLGLARSTPDPNGNLRPHLRARRRRAGIYLELTHIRKPQNRPQLISYKGRLLQPKTALYLDLIRPDLPIDLDLKVFKIFSCRARGPAPHHAYCCNPHHASFLDRTPPAPPPPSRADLLQTLIEEFCDAHTPSLALFDTLYTHTGDWPLPDLQAALHALHTEKRITPAWRAETLPRLL